MNISEYLQDIYNKILYFFDLVTPSDDFLKLIRIIAILVVLGFIVVEIIAELKYRKFDCVSSTPQPISKLALAKN